MAKMKKYRVPNYAITEQGLKRLLRQAAKEHASHSDWAATHGITPQAVSAWMRKTQGAGLQIPQALGYKPQTVYIPVDEDPICQALPPRRPTDRPTSKVDHTKDPIEKKLLRKKNTREETKKRLKKRNKK